MLLCLFPVPASTASPPGPAQDAPPGAPYEILIAPNPLQVGLNGSRPRLRVIARQTGLLIERIDVYSMAGEPVRSLRGSELALPTGPYIPAGTTATTEGWWDLRSAEGTMVASGSYWIRLVVIPIASDGIPAPAMTLIRALVLVR